MTPIDWAAIFEHGDRRAPLPEGLLTAVSASVTTPLDPEEVRALAAENAPDPGRWEFPAHPLPASYLAFLAWSNGGGFVNGDREFQMLAAEELREYMLTYRLPYHLPGTVPFALDGEGGFYLFDLRHPPDAAGESPVLYAGTGGLGFDSAVEVGRSFVEACRGRTDPRDRPQDPA